MVYAPGDTIKDISQDSGKPKVQFLTDQKSFQKADTAGNIGKIILKSAKVLGANQPGLQLKIPRQGPKTTQFTLPGMTDGSP